MAFKVRRKKGVNALRVGLKIGTVVLALYVGGFFLTQIGAVMTNTSSPFYVGLRLIGWTVNTSVCGDLGSVNNCLSSTDTSTSILAVVGIIAVASIIFEFVEISF